MNSSSSSDSAKRDDDGNGNQSRNGFSLWSILPGEVKIFCTVVLFFVGIFAVASIEYGMSSLSASFSEYRERHGTRHPQRQRSHGIDFEDTDDERPRIEQPSQGLICDLTRKHLRRPKWCQD